MLVAESTKASAAAAAATAATTADTAERKGQSNDAEQGVNDIGAAFSSANTIFKPSLSVASDIVTLATSVDDLRDKTSVCICTYD